MRRKPSYPADTNVNGGGTPSGVFIYPNAKRADSVFFVRSAHWKFNEGAGAVAADSSGNANDLALNAPYAWVAGGAPNGSDSSLQISNGFATTALTAEQSRDITLNNAALIGWTAFLRIKPVLAASVNVQLVIRKLTMPPAFDVGSWIIGIFGTGGGVDVGKFFLATYGGSTITTPARVDDGNWHDFVVIKDFSRAGEYCKIYQDGVLVATSATLTSAGNDQSTHQLSLANGATGGEQPEIAEAAFLPFAIPTTVPALLWNGGAGAQRRLDDVATGLIELSMA